MVGVLSGTVGISIGGTIGSGLKAPVINNTATSIKANTGIPTRRFMYYTPHNI
jgi:hypothetical protein